MVTKASNTDSFKKIFMGDPRYYQIASLWLFLLYGLFFIDLEISFIAIVLTLGVGLLTQFICDKAYKRPSFNWKSGLISSTALCLLFRAEAPYLNALAAALAMSSKFLLSYEKRHFFNPANFGIVVMILLFNDSSWVSPGQWGQASFFFFSAIFMGFFVIFRSHHFTCTLTFLVIFSLSLILRSLYYEISVATFYHQMTTGALLLFSFFMISDPMTTPDSIKGKIIFSTAVALLSHCLIFYFNLPYGIFYALFILCILNPLLNLIIPGIKYRW